MVITYEPTSHVNFVSNATNPTQCHCNSKLTIRLNGAIPTY